MNTPLEQSKILHYWKNYDYLDEPNYTYMTNLLSKHPKLVVCKFFLISKHPTKYRLMFSETYIISHNKNNDNHKISKAFWDEILTENKTHTYIITHIYIYIKI